LGRDLRSASLLGTALGRKWPVSRKSISSCVFVSRGVTYLFGNLRTGA